MISEISIVFDSNVNERIKSRARMNMMANIPLKCTPFAPPETIICSFRVTATDENGKEITLMETKDNHQRLVRIPLGQKFRNVRLTVLDDKPKKVVSFRIR